METIKELLKEEAKKININLSEEMIEKFFKYKNLLKEWNKKINLTAIIEDEEIIIKHFIDSLTIEKYIPKNAKIIDVGTGAGFPGIPIKIIREDVDVLLLDSLKKRVNFLKEIINECDLKNINALHGRAEDVGQNKKYREAFDVSTARAVANIATLTEICTPFIKVGGSFLCMKADADDEIEDAKKALEKLNLICEKIDKFKLSKIDANRTIIIYKKKNPTPKIYPRKAGTPAKDPIK